MRAALTAERLREVIDYDAETGVFTWRETLGSRAAAGDPAGTIKPPKNYVCITVGGQRYYAHRLAWLWVSGAWPAAEIDHRNLDHGDNRWDNLRPASRGQNRCNQRAHRDSASGLKGASFNKRRGTWYAAIQKNKQHHHLGVFATAEQAHTAYVEGARRLHGDFARSA